MNYILAYSSFLQVNKISVLFKSLWGTEKEKNISLSFVWYCMVLPCYFLCIFVPFEDKQSFIFRAVVYVLCNIHWLEPHLEISVILTHGIYSGYVDLLEVSVCFHVCVWVSVFVHALSVSSH